MKKVLVIEDDPIVANIYRNKLSVEGYQVEMAGDGESGLEALHQFRPDAVILDLMLPKLSGVEVLKQVRAEPDFQNLPVIVFSNTYLTNMVQQAWKAGASKCLSKASCSPKQLLDVVRTYLSPNGASPAPAATAAPAPAAAVRPANHAPMAAPTHAKPVPAPPEPVSESPSALRKTVLESFPSTLAALRTLLQATIKTNDQSSRVTQLGEIRRRIHTITGNAGLTDLRLIATMSAALEALLLELQDKPNSINASTLRTIAGAIDFLGVLFEHGRSAARQEVPLAKILVVDDEPISCRAIVSALERAHLKATAVDNPETAYTLLAGSKYDLVLLDVDMPGMNGHELCAKLRALPDNQHSPVIFVTVLAGFETRASAMMSGGNDFIAKPFLSLELAVKALVHILRSQIGKHRPAITSHRS